MSDVSQLQLKLNVLLQQLLPVMNDNEYTFVFQRTRTKNAQAAKWVMNVFIGKKKLRVQSAVPARELTKTMNRVRVLSNRDNEVWIGYELNVDALVEQLRSSPLWVPRVQKAIERTIKDHQ